MKDFKNFLPISQAHEIHDILTSNIFPWYWLDDVTVSKEEGSEVPSHCRSQPGMHHTPYVNGRASEWYDKFSFIYHNILDAMGLDCKDWQLDRIRCGLNFHHQMDCLHHQPHIDYPETQVGDHFTCLYYVNDSDGPTVVFNETEKSDEYTIKYKCHPEKNKLFVFDGKHYHASSCPKEHDARLVVTINLSSRARNEQQSEIRSIPEIRSIRPDNLGWVEQKLSPDAMSFLWHIIDNHGSSYKDKLAGNINSSYALTDENDWFLNNVLANTINFYINEFQPQKFMYVVPSKQELRYCLSDMWVNFQKQTEFNPIHAHSGYFSFVIWMKIPTTFEEQKKLHIASDVNSNCISNFEMRYSDILGRQASYIYGMNPDAEGTMLFFPSSLNHSVYPFYNCDEDRISISGNIMVESYT